jgi:GDP/UDP-N,N'-diacetylbacillosamine 2-epimerase (hydrolysing)
MGQRAIKRRICVVTGTRAEYGLLKPVMEAIEGHENLKLQLIVTGMHLLRRFGYTVREIEKDGGRIDGRVRLQGEDDEVIGQSRGLGRAITKLTNLFSELDTEIVLVLGDRIETFAAAAAATASQLVLAHIHGGDVAPGVQDDAYRHAISKLAHLHFAATAGAKERLLRLGEDSFRIYQTGSPALDNLSKIICRDTKELSKWAKFDVREDFLMVLQHPAGGTAAQEEKRMVQTLAGCDVKGLRALVLYPNCDPGFSGIIRAVRHVCGAKGYRMIKHLPRGVYLGLLERTRVLVGNSSSGIIEASRINVDVVNVGHRQAGREHCRRVHDVDYGRAAVAKAVRSICRSQKRQRSSERIYGDGRSGQRIASILGRVKLEQKLRLKKIAY